MSLRLHDVVRYRCDRLFNGAVNIDWFLGDPARCADAARNFVFHGPTYHGVTQDDIGYGHGHRLQDTVTFTRDLLRRCTGQENQPFTLAIAGYGTGKSHLGLSLAQLLSDPEGDVAQSVLSGLGAADEAMTSEISAALRGVGKSFLVVALNGMRSFDLTAEVTRQVLQQLRDQELAIGALEELQPRFAQAVSLIRMSNERTISELLEHCEATTVEEVVQALHDHDESTYSAVHDFLSARGMPIRALGGESVRDVIEAVCRDHCGEGKTFAGLVILFDEFGKYTEFATERSQIAGSGALQDLFEGVQSNSDLVCLVGFIQFELNAYVDRVAAEHKNEILRYVSRYQTAAKSHLSINLETLMASLLETPQPELLDSWLEQPEAIAESAEIAGRLGKWFPQVRNHRLWTDPERFHCVIRKGCWPLSPFSSWFLFYLAAAGKHLQERSALALLDSVLRQEADSPIPEEGGWSLAPVDLWSDELQQELLVSEERGQQGAITHSYATAASKHGDQLTRDLKRILRAIVIAAKMGLRVPGRDEAVEALAELAGMPSTTATSALAELRDEQNVIEWDEGSKQFDILGDAVPRSQFLAFVKQKVDNTYSAQAKATLFAGRASEWCDLLVDLECDFAEEFTISTREWRYEKVTSNIELLPTHLKLAAERWKDAIGIDVPRGTVVYCYAEPNRALDQVMGAARKTLRATARAAGVKALPILIVVLCDDNGMLGQTLAELAVIEDSLTEQDRARFGNLVAAHEMRTRLAAHSHIERLLKQGHFVVPFDKELGSHRLGRLATMVLSRIYTEPLPFPFDGFSTTKGNAAETCQQLTAELLHDRLDYDAVIAKPAKTKNRAIGVLKNSWVVYSASGAVSRQPRHPVARKAVRRWDKALRSEEGCLPLGKALRELCMPPHGANLASAGLLLGVFVAARTSELMVSVEGQSCAIDQWFRDETFRGRLLDLERLERAVLIPVGETASEWDSLLEEWELVEDYPTRIKCLEHASELIGRIPVPSTLNYRFLFLQDQAEKAKSAEQAVKEKKVAAEDSLARGRERKDVEQLSLGAAALLGIVHRMTEESSRWPEREVEDLRATLGEARERIKQFFRGWLLRQAPRGDTLEEGGEFKRRMLTVIGGHLRDLSLDTQREELEKHTRNALRQTEAAADARTLIRDVNSWLRTDAQVTELAPVVQIRKLREMAKGLASKLQGMSRRIELTELPEVRGRLADSQSHLGALESRFTDRLAAVDRAKLRSLADLLGLKEELAILLDKFEGCENEASAIRRLLRVLQIYERDYQELSDERLAWSFFLSLASRLTEEAKAELDGEAVPWPAWTVYAEFVKEITSSRKQLSSNWIMALEVEAAFVPAMEAPDADRLLKKVQAPPPCLTEQDAERLSVITLPLEQRLNSLAVEWLLERFRQLPHDSKNEFLERAMDHWGEDGEGD
ncbi:MAG: hypothetical protein HN406_15180 [Lentisphaerae bacterium]|jgi:hypothetical protein|nr:hypothetical protein [Lentisphaerota bacterium]